MKGSVYLLGFDRWFENLFIRMLKVAFIAAPACCLLTQRATHRLLNNIENRHPRVVLVLLLSEASATKRWNIVEIPEIKGENELNRDWRWQASRIQTWRVWCWQFSCRWLLELSRKMSVCVTRLSCLSLTCVCPTGAVCELIMKTNISDFQGLFETTLLPGFVAYEWQLSHEMTKDKWWASWLTKSSNSLWEVFSSKIINHRYYVLK